jgi:hypothetical protein
MVVSIKDRDSKVDRGSRKGLRRSPEKRTLILVQRIGWRDISLLIYTEFSLEESIRSYMSS